MPWDPPDRFVIGIAIGEKRVWDGVLEPLREENTKKASVADRRRDSIRAEADRLRVERPSISDATLKRILAKKHGLHTRTIGRYLSPKK